MSLKFFSEYKSPTSKFNYVQIYIATGCLDKVFVDYVTPNPNEFRRFYYNIYSSWISLFYRDKAGYLLFVLWYGNK